eukprot:13526992-Alexandrium_andersonii.AAC.1
MWNLTDRSCTPPMVICRARDVTGKNGDVKFQPTRTYCRSDQPYQRIFANVSLRAPALYPHQPPKRPRVAGINRSALAKGGVCCSLIL